MTTTSTSVREDEFLAYWEALSAADAPAAYDVFSGAVARGVPLQGALDKLVAAAQLKVGDLWACNEWTVAQEHRVTAVTEEVLERVSLDLPARADGPTVVVACVEREWHAMASLILTVTLRAAGVRVDYLGANVRPADIAARIVAVRPRAVLLSASLNSSLARVRPMVELCRELGTPVVLGGTAFDAAGVRADRLGATSHARTAAEAIELIDRAPESVAPLGPLDHPGVAEAAALQERADELARLVLSTAGLHLGMDAGAAAVRPDDWRVVLATFVPHVLDCLVGALLTEDPTVMTETRVWLDDVLSLRDADPRCGAEIWEALRWHLRDQPLSLALLVD